MLLRLILFTCCLFQAAVGVAFTLQSSLRTVVPTPVTAAAVPDTPFLSDSRMLKCAFLCADNDDDVNMYVDAFNIKHAASRPLLRAPKLHHITPVQRTPESCVSIHLWPCCAGVSAVLLTADASTWLAAIVGGDYAGITKRSGSTHPTETSAFQYGLCEDTHPPPRAGGRHSNTLGLLSLAWHDYSLMYSCTPMDSLFYPVFGKVHLTGFFFFLN